MNNEPDRELTARLDIDFALKAAGLGVWEVDPATNLVIWDDRCRQLFGLASDNRLPYEQAIQYIHPDDAGRVDEAVRRAMDPRSGGRYDVTYRTIGADDGRLRWVRFMGQGYFTATGDVYRFAGVAQDVTVEEENRQALRNSEARLRDLISESPVATALYVGENLRIEVANELILNYWNKDASVLGKPYRQAVPELEGQGFFELLEQVYRTGEGYSAHAAPARLTLDNVPGTYYFDFSFKPLRDDNGAIFGILNTAIDVTAQVKARQELATAESDLRGAIELAQLATWHLDATTGRVTYSPRFLDWLGLPTESQPLTDAYDFLPDDYRQSVMEALNAVLQPGSAGVFDSEHPIVNRQTGQMRIIHAQAQVAYDANGEPQSLRGTAQDVTEQRRIRQELERQVQQRTQQLQASINDLERSNANLQQFAYVASHDLQEPLRKIQSFGDLLRDQYAEHLGDGAEHLKRMQAAAHRMSLLIRDLLTFSRLSTQSEATRPVPLNGVIDATLTDLDLLIAETGATIDVAPLPTIVGDPSQLGQLFHNLLTNALKFRRPDEPPRVTVRAGRVAATDLPPTTKPTRPADAYHRIDVQDNGIGFDPRYTDRIFQVFQRLHGQGQYAGTGIGLAICEKVAANHGGAITASSQPGEGATFSVYLPA